MTRFSALGLAVATLLLAACGGSGGSQTAGIDGSGAPIATNTTSNGTLNGFGSVIVNGVKYESDSAQVFINGERRSVDDLRVGYQVSVDGTVIEGVNRADSIRFVPTLIGAITRIDTASKQLQVLDKTVQITNDTLFDAAITPASLAGLQPGVNILVSGLQAADGSIRATRIEPVSGQVQQVTGQVANLTDSRFSLGNVTVLYSGAQLSNLSNNRLSNGARVTVLGSLVGNELQATQVIGISQSLPRNTANADIEGFVTRYASSTDFDVAGISVTTTAQTRVENGSLSDLRLGAEVEVEGRVNAEGILVARKLEFEQESNNKVSGLVTAISLVTGGTVVTGSLTVDGLVITTTQDTLYEDKQLNLKRFNLASLTQGDAVEVTGYSSGNQFIATKVERKEADEDDDSDEESRELEGTITELGADYVVIFGRRIYLNEATQILLDDDALTLSSFLASALDQQAEIEAYLLNGEWYAREIHLVLGDTPDSDDDELDESDD